MALLLLLLLAMMCGIKVLDNHFRREEWEDQFRKREAERKRQETIEAFKKREDGC